MTTTRTWATGAVTALIFLTAAGTGVAGAAESGTPPPESLQAMIDEADDLRDAGFVEASQEKAQEIVAAHGEDALPASLRPSDSREGVWQSAIQTTGPYLRTAAELIALALALLLAALLARGAHRSYRARRSLTLDVAPFTGPGSDEIAASMASALREHLKRLDEDRMSTGPRLAEAADADFTLPSDVTTAFPPSALIAALVSSLDRLLPRNLIKLTSTLRPVDEFKGAGVTLLLCKGGEELGQVTIWEHDYHLQELVSGAAADDLQGRYQRLVRPAAIWLAYQPAMGSQAEPRPAGTEEWRSYARFAVGECAHQFGNPQLACRLYREALDLDTSNRAARLNLAWLLVGPVPDETDEERDARRAEFEKHVAFVRGDRPRPADPLWYRATYLEAIHQLYCGANDPAKYEIAALTAGGLLHAIESGPPDGVEKLAPLLETMRGPVKVLSASIRVERGIDGPDPLTDAEWLLPTTHYNLACYFTRKFRKAREAGDDEAMKVAEGMAILHLRQAIARLGASYTGVARRDPGLKPLHGSALFDKLVPPPTPEPDRERRIEKPAAAPA